jgi:curved DNA-binding protein CbpA
MKHEHDPYKVLRVSKDFTRHELKTNYKRLALQLHPDKNLVSREQAAEIFKILTASYKHLEHELELRESDRTFDELRTSARRHVEEAADAGDAARATTAQPFSAGDGRFDAGRFNAFFSEHRLSDPVADRGYGDWMRTNDVAAAKKAKAKDVPKECKSLMLHIDALSLGRSKLAFSQMGVDEVDDYTVDGVGMTATDLRVAYTEREKEELEFKRQRDYNNVEELKRDRAKISYTLNDKEQVAYERYKNWAEDREAARLNTLRQRDVLAERHHGQVQRLLTVRQ